jgi:hypothetical protein
VVALENGKTVVAILISIEGGLVRRVFIHADPARLGHLGIHNAEHRAHG